MPAGDFRPHVASGSAQVSARYPALARRCAVHNGVRALRSKDVSAGSSIDSDHYVGRFDDRIRFSAGLKPQLVRGLFGDN